MTMSANGFWKKYRRGLQLLGMAWLSVWFTAAQAEQGCGNPLQEGWVDDYRNPSAKKHLEVVEKAHFTPYTRHGSFSVFIGNMDYTLRHFPNHYPALLLVAQRERKERQNSPDFNPGLSKSGLPMTVECYFTRAIQFSRDDYKVYLLYGIHLHLTGQLDKALEQYKAAEKLAPESAELHNNLGLLYFDREQYDDAKVHAEKAYRLGYPLPGLRDKLTAIGHWR